MPLADSPNLHPLLRSLPPSLSARAAADAARDFVQSCLQRDEKLRPSAEQLLEHPWLQDELHVSDAPFSDTIVQRLQRFGLYGRWGAGAAAGGRCAAVLSWPAAAGPPRMQIRDSCTELELLLAPPLAAAVLRRLPTSCLLPPCLPPSLPQTPRPWLPQVPPGGPQGGGARHGWRQRGAGRHAAGLPDDGHRPRRQGDLLRGKAGRGLLPASLASSPSLPASPWTLAPP